MLEHINVFFLPVVNEELIFVFHVSHIFLFQATTYLSNFIFSFVRIRVWKQKSVTEHKMTENCEIKVVHRMWCLLNRSNNLQVVVFTAEKFCHGILVSRFKMKETEGEEKEGEIVCRVTTVRGWHFAAFKYRSYNV